jgi:glutamate mutase epsilon subunit
MTNVEALQALYVALGGNSAEVANATQIVDILNAIAGIYGGTSTALQNADAIANIAAVGSAIAPTKQSKTVTPTTSKQNITADSGKVLEKVTVNAVTAAIDANIVAGNIRSGVTILGVEGTYTGE